jgi:hypothetical protein
MCCFGIDQPPVSPLAQNGTAYDNLAMPCSWKNGDGMVDRQKSRHFREMLQEVLSDFKDDMESDEPWSPDFDPYADTDPDAAPGLIELFQGSGMDLRAPGHWQILLVAVLNAIHREAPGPDETWTPAKKNEFLRDMSQLRKEHRGVGILKLCEHLREEYPKKYLATAESLRTTFQKVLREKRDQIDRGEADPQTREWVQEFDKK